MKVLRNIDAQKKRSSHKVRVVSPEAGRESKLMVEKTTRMRGSEIRCVRSQW